MGTAFRFGQFYIPLWCVMIFNTWAYYNVIVSMKGTVGGVTLTPEMSKKLRTMTRTLRAYPMILLVCWTPGTINRIYQTTLDAGEEGDNETLATIHIFFGSITGLFNSLVYGYFVRKLLWQELEKCRGRTPLPDHRRMDSQGDDELLEPNVVELNDSAEEGYRR